MPLFPFDASRDVSSLSHTKLEVDELVSAAEVDFEKQRLVVITENGSLLSMNLVNRSISRLRLSIEESSQYRHIKRAHFVDDRLFWITSSCGDSHPWDTCFYGEEWDSEKKVDILPLSFPEQKIYRIRNLRLDYY